MGHGYSKSKHYSVWLNMKSTCKKCDVPLFKEWTNYLPFRDWSYEHGYKEGLFLERIDKKKGYFPDNLKFVHKDVPENRVKHGMHDTRLYGIWQGIKQRCLNPKDTGYKDYGGKGITVCEDWKYDFSSFYKWSIEHHYNDDLTLDRIENDKGYSPENCRWATVKEQLNNQDRNIRIKLDGKTKTLTQWSEHFGLNPVTVSGRYHRQGLRGKELFADAEHKSAPVYIEINGIIKTMSEWEKETGIHRNQIRKRLDKGLTGKDLISKERDNSLYAEVDGIRKTLRDWCKTTDVTYDVILRRYHEGITGEDLIKPENDKEVYIEIDGIKKTMSEWAKTTPGLTYLALSQRYRSGKTGKELLKPVTKQKIEIEYNGKTQYLNAWGKELAIDPETLRRRYYQGLREEKLFAPSSLKVNTVTINGVTKTLREWSDISGVNIHTIRGRYRKGITGEALLEN